MADLACTPTNSVYTINVQVHTHKEFIKNINEESPHLCNSADCELDALEDFYGTIFTMINDIMRSYKIKFTYD